MPTIASRCLIAASLTALMPSAASAGIIDGIFTADDSYQAAFALDASNGTQLLDGGVLRLGQDAATGDVAVHITVPTSYVDNTYGTRADDPASGWEKGHEFKQLVGSDNLKFTLDTGFDSYDVELDYLDKTDRAGAKSSSGIVKSVATSLEWNLANVSNDKVNSADPFSTLWQDALQYEFVLDGAFLTSNLTLANFSDFSIHASPSKNGGTIVASCIDRNDCLPSTPPSSSSGGGEVPEPAGLAILGMLGLVGAARRGGRKS